MNIAKRILGHLYFFSASIFFAITMLIILLPVWIISKFPQPRSAKYLHPVFRVWMGIFMPIVGCGVSRKGAKNFEKGKNYIVVCNHNTFVDIPVSSPWIPGANMTLAKSELAKIPLWGIVYKAGSILVDRSQENSRRDSLKAMLNTLDEGLHLCLYPEGSRNKTEKPIAAFFDGAFSVAIKAQKPIMPALIFNTRVILPQKPKLWAWPHKIHFHFLPPVPTEGLTADDIPMLKQKVHELMSAYYVANKTILS